MKIQTTAVAITLAAAVTAIGAYAADKDVQNLHRAHIDHVLLISVDGLHALDLARFTDTYPHSAMAELVSHGVSYTNSSLPANSDSFPGLLALVTGGSPVSHGVFYDVSYDRGVFDPSNTTCAGRPGAAVILDESIDKYAGTQSLNVVDPAKLPRVLDASGHCVPLYPHSFVKTNTIFEVVRTSGRRTAWADKHPAYDLVNGPSGTGVEDLYTPEITNVDGFDATASVVCTAENDALKVKAVLNEIRGLKHDGTSAGSVPAVFGMNFQAVSVGQKVAKDNADPRCNTADGNRLRGLAGGYRDGSGTPTDVLAYGLQKTDEALGDMIQELKRARIYDSTLFVLTAKHGQSPINPVKVNKVGHFSDVVASLPDAAASPAAQTIAAAANCSAGPCGLIQDDDVAFIWLPDQSKTSEVAAYLNANANALSIETVYAGPSLRLKFNDPQHDSRSPDIIVQPQYGTIYTGSAKKNAEHGGMSVGDTNVALVVSNPNLRSRIVKSPVSTAQVAPTILEALGLDADDLKSVRIEHTSVLPGLSGEDLR
jgi:hypothetical protein